MRKGMLDLKGSLCEWDCEVNIKDTDFFASRFDVFDTSNMFYFIFIFIFIYF
jgi:hypothetical protein